MVEHTAENRGVAGSSPALAMTAAPCVSWDLRRRALLDPWAERLEGRWFEFVAVGRQTLCGTLVSLALIVERLVVLACESDDLLRHLSMSDLDVLVDWATVHGVGSDLLEEAP